MTRAINSKFRKFKIAHGCQLAKSQRNYPIFILMSFFIIIIIKHTQLFTEIRHR